MVVGTMGFVLKWKMITEPLWLLVTAICALPTSPISRASPAGAARKSLVHEHGKMQTLWGEGRIKQSLLLR
jgi:hypothetical protein